MLLQCKTPVQRQVPVLLREGHTRPEIAERLHIHENTIRRLLQALRPPGGVPHEVRKTLRKSVSAGAVA
jgi:transposase